MFKVEPRFLPNRGIELTKPEQFLNKRWSPYCRNMQYTNEKIQGRLGVTKFDAYAFPDPVLLIDQYWKQNSTYDLMVATKRDIAKYDFSNTRYDFLTPVYQTGKVKVVNASATVRGGLEIDNCDTDPVAWVDGSGGDVTPSRNTTSPQDGTAFVRLTVGAGAGVELLAYHDISSINLSAYKSVGFWLRSSVALSASDLQFLIDDTSACASALKTLNIGAISANTWTWVNLSLGDASALTAVISIGIYQAVDKGAFTLDIDQIVAGVFTTAAKEDDFFKIGTSDVNSDATWYEVAAVVSDTELTLTAVYAGSSASQQAFTIRDTFTGSDSDLWQRTEFLDLNEGEIWCATNGVDTPIWYNGTGQVQVFTGLPTGFTSAKFITQFFDRIVFAWTVEDGTNQPIRIRWGEPGNAFSYDDLDFNDLTQPDFTYWIQGLVVYDDYLVIPKESGAYIARPVDNDNDFDFAFTSKFFGSFSAYSTVNVGGKIHYFGYENRFRTATIVQDEPTFDDLAPYTRTVNPTAAQLIFGYLAEYLDQVRWLLPYDDTLDVQPMIVYDYKNDVKQIWEYNHASGFACIGEYLNVEDLYVDDPVWADLYVDEQIGYWDERRFLSSAPIILYGGRDGYVYTADFGTTDDGNTYQRVYQTVRDDFKMPHKNKRLWKQQWWLDAETDGSVAVKIQRNDATSFDAQTKTISLINNDRDIIKMPITWDKEFESALNEVSASNHFALYGYMNWVSDKGKVVA